jgi:hypothetical protein
MIWTVKQKKKGNQSAPLFRALIEYLFIINEVRSVLNAKRYFPRNGLSTI